MGNKIWFKLVTTSYPDENKCHCGGASGQRRPPRDCFGELHHLELPVLMIHSLVQSLALVGARGSLAPVAF